MKTRKRKLTERLHSLGLCISYERVLEIRRAISAISIFQHFEIPVESDTLIQIESTTASRKSRLQLPKSYTDIRPTRGGQPEPIFSRNDDVFTPDRDILSEAKPWLNRLSEDENEMNAKMSFSAYFSSLKKREVIQTKSHLLPLIPEPVTSPATVRHAMMQVIAITKRVNPQQNAVITGDQPVYALGKQIQWMFQDEFKDVIWIWDHFI